LVAALVDLGYEPGCDGPTSVRLCNCPFRAIAELAPGLICGLNYELVAGVVEGLDLDRARVRLEPDPPNCCLTVAVDR
jgi:predicted ArsR family transcriptional regulator